MENMHTDVRVPRVNVSSLGRFKSDSILFLVLVMKKWRTKGYASRPLLVLSVNMP